MSEIDNKVKMIVEGLLLAAGRPMSLDAIAQVFSARERPDRSELKAVMAAIGEDCQGRGFELQEVASGYRFQVRQELSEWVAKLWEERPPRYTRALLETLALIAYRQPITRGDIEEIRGVAVSPNIIRTLLDRDWVRVVGHRDVPGRPAMFATTRQFLDYFNLKNLQDLPPLSEIKELEKPEQELDLGDVFSDGRVLEMPEESEADYEAMTAEEHAELLAEEEAVELAKKPLDEILQLGLPEHLRPVPDPEDEDEFDEADPDAGDESEAGSPRKADLAATATEEADELDVLEPDAGEESAAESAQQADVAAADPEHEDGIDAAVPDPDKELEAESLQQADTTAEVPQDTAGSEADATDGQESAAIPPAVSQSGRHGPG